MFSLMRGVISLLVGIGSGTVGFWLAWNGVWAVTGEHPGLRYDAWLLAGIFVPGIGMAFLAFWLLSRPGMSQAASNPSA